MTEETAEANASTTDESVDQQNNLLTSGNDADRATSDLNTTNLTDEVTIEKGDYGYVPDKFFKEGKPDFEQLSTSYTELEQKLRTTRPSAPKDVEAYQYEGNVELDEESTAAFKESALEAGLSPEQYSWVMNQYEESLALQQNATYDSAQDNLKEAWGEEFDSNLDKAKAAWGTFGEGLDMNEVGNNPIVLQLLARIGAEVGEDSGINDVNTNNAGVTADEIEMEVQELRNREDYWTNKAVQNKVQQLYEKRSALKR